MEIKRYFRTLQRWWWLVSVATLVVTAASVVFTFMRTPTYKSQTTLLVSPTAQMSNLSEVRASLSVLDKPVVANTYAEIAQSQVVITAAWQDLNVPQEVQERYEIHSSVRQRTNIIVLTVEGPDPALARDLADAIAKHTMAYVDELYEVYDLKPLDPATEPLAPTGLGTKVIIAIGVALGVSLGTLAAFTADYLRGVPVPEEQISIVDLPSGAYKSSFFLHRLREEMGRSRRHSHPLSVVLLRLEDLHGLMTGRSADARNSVLRQVVALLRRSLHEGDLVARWENDDLAVMLPDCDADAALRIMERIRNKIEWTPLEIDESGFKVTISTTAGVTTYDMNGSLPLELMGKAARALERAEGAEERVYVLVENGPEHA